MSPALETKIRDAARRAVDQAPELIPGSPQWQRLATVFASIPDAASAPRLAGQEERSA